jgi:hypothetical protein
MARQRVCRLVEPYDKRNCENLKGEISMSRRNALASRFLVAILLFVAPTASFAFGCYCNGVYIGEFKTILGCYNACHMPARSDDPAARMRADLFGSPLCAAASSEMAFPDLAK